MTKLPPNINFLEDKNLSLEILLDSICEQLQLDPTRERLMQKAYTTVSEIIENDDSFFGNLKPLIYVYGSKAIGTTTKPYGRDEFDLDFIVKVVYDWTNISLDDFLLRLFNLLNSNGKYKDKVELKRFCVRINYKSDFHMDIMPGCEIPFKKEKLKVPDTKLKFWVIRNPKGYIRWFESKYILDYSTIRLNDYYKEIFELKAKAEIEEMPTATEYSTVQPLQRSVQLFKRYRDIYFESNPEYATSSIIITTIAGMFYKDELSILDTIDGILNRVMQVVSNHSSTQPFEIINPADLNENIKDRERLSDKWMEGEKGKKRYEAFLGFLNDFAEKWIALRNLDEKPHALLTSLFGEKVTERSFENQVKLAGSWRNSSSLFVRPTGLLTINPSGAKALPKTTIHGSYSSE